MVSQYETSMKERASVLLSPDRKSATGMKNRLKEMRAAKGWSEADLARELWVAVETIQAIEIGTYEPPLPLAIEIAKAFGQTVETIFLCEDRSVLGKEND